VSENLLAKERYTEWWSSVDIGAIIDLTDNDEEWKVE
jgi:hypothetical protein